MRALKDYLLADKDDFQGYVDPRFKDLAVQFSRMQSTRAHQGGAALVVYFEREKVIDIFIGQKNTTTAWNADTLSICYSTGKGVLATLAHILVSRGFLDYDQPIAEYWPEFSQEGKSTLTLRHLLSHESGLYDIRHLIKHASEMSDWNHMLSVVEQAKPRFEIGSENAYQALTFGWLVGGALEKATQKSLAVLLAEFLVNPLELDGAYFGIPKHELNRLAKPLNYQDPATRQHRAALKKKTQLEQQINQHDSKKNKSKQSQFNLIGKAIELSGQNPQDFLDAMVPKSMNQFSFFDDETAQSCIPAANGAFTAISLAKIYAMLANQGVWDDHQLINTQTYTALSTIQNHKRDRVMPIPMKWRLGYHRVLTLGKSAENGFGHIGYNGSGAWCDPDRSLSFAYTHNFPTGSITGDYRLWGLSQEALRCADKILKGKKGWF